MADTNGGTNLALDQHAMAVAAWTFGHDQPAGRGTDTLPAASLRYLPLRTAKGNIGMLGIWPAESGQYLTAEQCRLLEASASLAAVAIEEECQPQEVPK